MPDPSDISWPLRRALFIRAKLAGGSKGRLEIDSDLLDALLTIGVYKYGARSLEKLVLPLKSPEGQPIRNSSLPPPDRLGMHVKREEFEKILTFNTAYRTSEVIQKTLAEQIHKEWRKSPGARGKVRNVPFERLDPIDKEDNRAAARRIPEVLALLGLGVATKEEAQSLKMNAPAKAALAAYVAAHVERLAEAEHNGWMAHRAKNGWTYGTPRDDAKKIHDRMLRYADLPPHEKDKDREAVTNYPEQVGGAGFRIVWLRGPTQKAKSRRGRRRNGKAKKGAD